MTADEYAALYEAATKAPWRAWDGLDTVDDGYGGYEQVQNGPPCVVANGSLVAAEAGDADAALIVALVNGYASGDLVPSAAPVAGKRMSDKRLADYDNDGALPELMAAATESDSRTVRIEREALRWLLSDRVWMSGFLRAERAALEAEHSAHMALLEADEKTLAVTSWPSRSTLDAIEASRKWRETP